MSLADNYRTADPQIVFHLMFPYDVDEKKKKKKSMPAGVTT